MPLKARLDTEDKEHIQRQKDLLNENEAGKKANQIMLHSGQLQREQKIIH